MFYFSKSKYTGLWQCPKIAWMRKYMPEEQKLDDSVLQRMTAGNTVGDLAMGYFGDFVEVTAYNGEKIDIPKMIENTKAEMAKGTENICKASFEFEGLYCAVDILRKNGDGWDIYEVKSSSTHSDEKKENEAKQVYIADISYQKYVLEHCNVKVNRTYLIQINGDYIFDGTFDLQKFLVVSDVSEKVTLEGQNIEDNLAKARELLSSDTEPEIDLSEGCHKPYPCAFWDYCSKHLPKPSVFDLYRIPFKKALDYYYNNVISYEALSEANCLTNEKQLRQIDYYLNDRGTFVDKENIKTYLSRLSYPLYFLDFETMQPVIPEFVGTHPYQQIPFQYSLHYIEKEGGELKHTEFLAESGTDPRRALAEQLCADIPENVSVTAYNKSFECGRIKELAEMFPDLADHLHNIANHIVDLLDPFQKGYYYNSAMGGSFSIKSVLPAIYPDDPSLNYHNLEEVHNGSEAMTVFPQIQYMTPEKQAETRHNLLKYCELDTYAMVKVWEELVRVSK